MAISNSIRYSFLALILCFLASGIASLATGIYFNSTSEARRNAVVSAGNLLTLIVGGVLIIITSGIGLFAYMNPLGRKRSLLLFCGLVFVISLTCIGLGIGIWYQTLTMHDDSGEKWRTQWTYNLRRSFQEFDPAVPCCGFTSPRDAPALTDVCFEQSALPGCQDVVFSYADSYLRNIYTYVFGMTILDFIVFLMGMIFIQERNDDERFEKMAKKLFKANAFQQPASAVGDKDGAGYGNTMPPRI